MEKKPYKVTSFVIFNVSFNLKNLTCYKNLLYYSSTYHKGPFQLLRSLIISRVKINTMKSCIHAGVSEALDAEHCLLCGTEHGEGLIMKLALKMF